VSRYAIGVPIAGRSQVVENAKYAVFVRVFAKAVLLQGETKDLAASQRWKKSRRGVAAGKHRAAAARTSVIVLQDSDIVNSIA
jgi:hypothetical protein